MVDVHFPTTDGRELIFPRYTQPEKDQMMLLTQLQLKLPPQSSPRITSKGTMTATIPNNIKAIVNPKRPKQIRLNRLSLLALRSLSLSISSCGFTFHSSYY